MPICQSGAPSLLLLSHSAILPPPSDLLTRRGRRALTLERMEGGAFPPSSPSVSSLFFPPLEEDGGRKKFLDSTTYVVEVGGGGEERESLSPSFSPRKRRRDQGEKRGSLYLDFYLPGGERRDHSSQSRGRPPPSNIYLFLLFLSPPLLAKTHVSHLSPSLPFSHSISCGWRM